VQNLNTVNGNNILHSHYISLVFCTGKVNRMPLPVWNNAPSL